MFYTNYVDLCNKVNKSPSAVAEEIGFKRSVVTAWKDGRSPRQATLQKVATYFGCTVEDLLAETKKAPSETDRVEFDDFTYAAHNYSGRLTDADKETIKKMMATLAAANEEDNGQTDGGLQRSE